LLSGVGWEANGKLRVAMNDDGSHDSGEDDKVVGAKVDVAVARLDATCLHDGHMESVVVGRRM
jgi:hypothetical protein